MLFWKRDLLEQVNNPVEAQQTLYGTRETFVGTCHLYVVRHTDHCKEQQKYKHQNSARNVPQ